jgi:hypothetical protein
VKALDYQCALFSIANAAGQPLLIEDADAEEFVKMTRGIEIYVEIPRHIHPALPEIANRGAHRAYFHRYLKVARILGARAVIVRLPRRWANGQPTAMAEIEERLVDFYAADFEDAGLCVYFQIEAAGLGSPSLLDRVVPRLEAGRFFYTLDPTAWNPGGETVNDRQLEAILRYWEDRIQLVQFSRYTEDERGAARRLARLYPVVLRLPSLAMQAEAAEEIRALVEEVDIFASL